MAPSYHAQLEELDFDRRLNRDGSSPGRGYVAGDTQLAHTTRGPNRASDPSSDLESKSRTTHRRRIQVACGRCRKRKIKCSGDSGDGQGCSNCKSSGSPNCQFLRVNSSELSTKPSHSVWPYPLSNTTSPSDLPVGNYPAEASSKATSVSSYHFRYHRPPSDSLRGLTKSRSPFPASSNDCEGTYPAVYGVQPEEYAIVPSTTSGTITSYGESPESSKAWNLTSSMTRSYGVAYPDQDPGGPIGIPAYTCVAPSSHTSSPVDIPSCYPTMTPMPFHGESGDRTLPTPTSRGQLLGTIGAFSMTPTDMTGHGLPLAAGQLQRPEAFCDSKTNTPTKGEEGSTGILSSNLSALVTNRRPSSCQEMTYGLMPIHPNSSPRQATSNTTYVGAGPTDQAESTDAAATPGDGGGLMSLDSGSCHTVYGYTTREKDKRRSTGPGSIPTGTLANGLPYTRPGTPVALLNAPYNLIRTNSTTGYQSTAAPHASSITSPNNPDCY